MRRWTVSLLAVLAVVATGGCLTQKQVSSGFLGDKYHLMKPVDGNEKFRFYSDPKVDFNWYYAVIVDPVEIRIAPDAPGSKINHDDLEHLRDFFRSEIIRQSSVYGQVVDTPAPGVARLRTAITGVTPGEPALNVLLQTKLTGAGLGGAAYEAELVDSMTGQLLQCSMNSSKGSLLDLPGGLSVWGNARKLMEQWIRTGIERSRAARGTPNGQVGDGGQERHAVQNVRTVSHSAAGWLRVSLPHIPARSAECSARRFGNQAA